LVAGRSVLRSSSTHASMSSMPQTHERTAPFHLDDVAALSKQSEADNNRAYELGRRIHVALRKLQREQEEKSEDAPRSAAASSLAAAELDELIGQVADVGLAPDGDGNAAAPRHPRTPRPANLSGRVEEYVRHLLFRHFLEADGRLMAPSSLSSKVLMLSETAATAPSPPSLPLHVTDEEYLLACMGLTHDLHRYGLSRATLLDRDGVERSAHLVSQLFEFLMGLDFRNGPLRRRYDGTKYALKALETLLYELAVVANVGKQPNDNAGGHDHDASRREAKRPRSSNNEPPTEGADATTTTTTAWPLLPASELMELQARMVHRDELREALIKNCRDAQKAAKQAIFALHRGDSKRALQLLEECRSCIANRLLPMASEEPTLRHAGSLAGVMEEYAEAHLFAVWLYGREPNPVATTGGALPSRPCGVLLRLQDFGDVGLSLDEYVGGLCDLTGEIGRYAVLRGTARDVDGVQFCLQTVTDIYYALETIERLPQGAGKKMDPLRKAIEKMERMLYELSLSNAAGRPVRSDATAPAEPAARTEDTGDD
jgi:predicted translin family RNA/ssDNA-binding protein